MVLCKENVFQIYPSCYSLLRFFGDMGLCPIKDPEDRREDYLRAYFYQTIPVLVEWDPNGSMEGKIKFEKVDLAVMRPEEAEKREKKKKDLLERFAKIGIEIEEVSTDMFNVGSFCLELYHLNRPIYLLEADEKKRQEEAEKKKKIERRRRDLDYSLKPYYL